MRSTISSSLAQAWRLSSLGLLGRSLRNRSGAVVLLFGLTLIPLLGFVGGAIDFANAYRTRTKLQNTIDAAALAAGRAMDLGASESDAQQAGMKVLEANLGAGFPPGLAVNFEFGDSVVTANASIDVETYILGVVGVDKFPVEVTSIVNIAGGTFEVALVLDNSGSMSGSRISDLKTATKNLTNILFDVPGAQDRAAISLVPFSGSVKVGTQYATAPWMDQTGQSSIHKEHFDSNVTRWEMFNAIKNVGWAGCVEVRPSPHDVQDAPATGGDSMFVPLFAPDEPDTSYSYRNNYLSDDDGGCPPSLTGGTVDERQRRVCKYENQTASTSGTGATKKGPNHMCDSQAITPLTNVKSTILNAVDDMVAKGYTNIHHGIMWGWRSLSPELPFDEGKPYDEPFHSKVMIVMTDGANTFPNSSTHNQTWYSSYGYHAQNRLGASSNSTSALRAAMNKKTAEACTNAKAAGILIYTIAFDISDSNTVNMLRNCATSPAYALTIEDGNSLIAAFEAIAHDINKLRISG